MHVCGPSIHDCGKKSKQSVQPVRPCSYIPKTACRTRPSKDEHTELFAHDCSDPEAIDTEYRLTEYTN
jgi:hypothetical protein